MSAPQFDASPPLSANGERCALHLPITPTQWSSPVPYANRLQPHTACPDGYSQTLTARAQQRQKQASRLVDKWEARLQPATTRPPPYACRNYGRKPKETNKKLLGSKLSSARAGGTSRGPRGAPANVRGKRIELLPRARVFIVTNTYLGSVYRQA